MPHTRNIWAYGFWGMVLFVLALFLPSQTSIYTERWHLLGSFVLAIAFQSLLSRAFQVLLLEAAAPFVAGAFSYCLVLFLFSAFRNDLGEFLHPALSSITFSLGTVIFTLHSGSKKSTEMQLRAMIVNLTLIGAAHVLWAPLAMEKRYAESFRRRLVKNCRQAYHGTVVKSAETGEALEQYCGCVQAFFELPDTQPLLGSVDRKNRLEWEQGAEAVVERIHFDRLRAMSYLKHKDRCLRLNLSHNKSEILSIFSSELVNLMTDIVLKEDRTFRRLATGENTKRDYVRCLLQLSAQTCPNQSFAGISRCLTTGFYEESPLTRVQAQICARRVNPRYGRGVAE